MTSPATTRAIFLAGMAFASGAFASSDINKCVTASGHVTLTDDACPEGTQTVKVISGPADDGEESSAAAAPVGLNGGFTFYSSNC